MSNIIQYWWSRHSLIHSNSGFWLSYLLIWSFLDKKVSIWWQWSISVSLFWPDWGWQGLISLEYIWFYIWLCGHEGTGVQRRQHHILGLSIWRVVSRIGLWMGKKKRKDRDNNDACEDAFFVIDDIQGVCLVKLVNVI